MSVSPPKMIALLQHLTGPMVHSNMWSKHNLMCGYLYCSSTIIYNFLDLKLTSLLVQTIIYEIKGKH